MTSEAFIAAYADDRRAAEVKALETLKPYLLTAHRGVWMVTVVTKQDLWWNERYATDRHYSTGAYASVIADIERQRGTQNFIHRLVSASLVWTNFRDGEGTLLATTTAGYEQTVRAANLNRTLRAIHDVAEQQVSA